MDFLELILILFFLLIFSIFSFKKNLLSFEGILIANAVGLAAITYGPGETTMLRFFAVVAFFIIGEIASNYPTKKHEKRGIWNVVGNSLPALFVLSLIIIYPEHSLILELGFFGAISAALADTLSSEIGYYSKRKPILITTLKKVSRGVDGGVTLLGFIAAFFGSIIISLIYFSFYQNFFLMLIIIFAGLIGTIVDSLFGAVFETKKVLNNTHVNLIGCSSGALFALLFGIILLV
ncbi:MAG: DUF92 domain-containing protein [Candidatus ainarchaeum sp.]|nr:DUF92 domain-containing protein [Candidatus ainarchaeum sp.]